MNSNDSEFQLLETLGEAQKTTRTVSQRDLAKLSGLSLGMTNMLVKRFVSRGWVKLVKASGHTWFYALTPEGIDEIASRTYGFLRRTASTVKIYYDRIDSFVRETKDKGYQGIVYDAPFEIEFVFRYACSRHGLFFYSGDPQSLPQDLVGARYVRVGDDESIQAWTTPSGCLDVDVASILSRA